MFRQAVRVAARAFVSPLALRVVCSGAALSAGAALCSPARAAAAPPAAAAYTGVPGTPKERSFVALKPDAVQRGLIGEIVARFERKGFKLVAMKLVKPTKEHAAAHYADLSDKKFFPGRIDFFSSAPVLAMVWEGQDACKTIRQMLGTTNPAQSLPGSIRGDLCMITGRNIIHASDSPEAGVAEIGLWFKPEEVVEWTPVAKPWIYE